MPAANELPDYDEVDDVLGRVDISTDAAECHGMLCALLCAGKDPQANWLNEILPQDRAGEPLLAEVGQLLDNVFTTTQQQFISGDFSFSMLLPHDDDDLGKRLFGLSSWCQGFYLGLGIAGIQEFDSLPEDSREIVTDMTDIAQIGDEVEDAVEEDEAAYVEVVEYLRVGVLLIYEELNALQVATRH